MRVVFDTNVIISGLYSNRGASYHLLKDAISGDLAFVISPLVALEYEGMINEKIQDGLLKASSLEYDKVLDALFTSAIKIWEINQMRPTLPDLTDDKILECAINGGCTHIITFNKKHYPEAITKPYGIIVMTSGEFLEGWRGKQ